MRHQLKDIDNIQNKMTRRNSIQQPNESILIQIGDEDEKFEKNIDKYTSDEQVSHDFLLINPDS